MCDPLDEECIHLEEGKLTVIRISDKDEDSKQERISTFEFSHNRSSPQELVMH